VSPLARKLLVGFAVLGLAASSISTYVHYHLVTAPDYRSFCDITTTVRCSQAYLSRYGSIGGVPVAIGGIVFFAFVLLLAWGSRARSRIEDSAPAYIFTASTVALAMVLYLAYASFFILKEVCPLCVLTYVAVAGIFVVSGGVSSLPMSKLPARALRDVRLLVTTPVALLVALVFAAGAASAVEFFPRDNPAAARQQPAPAPLPDDQRSNFERWWDMQDKVQVPFDAEGAKVLVVKFNDYQCPPCRQTYFAYEPILAKYKDRPQDLKYVLKHFPLDPKCNSAVGTLVHPAACDAAAAAVMAVPKGTYDRLTDWFFTHQDELSPATVRTAARDVAGITDFDAKYASTLIEVKNDAGMGAMLGVKSTPTFFINGHMLPGGQDPRLIDAVIDLEMRRAAH
jgi:uncharacterized membrane protein/protein-disulfide isomerase